MSRSEDNVKSRASSMPEETGNTAAADPEAQAQQILTESEERTVDSATVNLKDDGVERRKADELTPDEHIPTGEDASPVQSTTKESKAT